MGVSYVASQGPSIALIAALLTLCGSVLMFRTRVLHSPCLGGRDRWVRSAALITTWSFYVLAGSTIYGLAHLVGSETALSGPDARLAIYCLLFGLGAMLVLSLLPTASEQHSVEDKAPAFTRWCEGCVVFWMATYFAQGVLSTSYDPKTMAALWVTMVALFAGWDTLQTRSDRRADRRIATVRSLALRQFRRQHGGRLDVCCLETTDLSRRRVIAWAFITPQRDRVLFDTGVGEELADWASSRPMTATKDGRAPKVKFLTSWLNGATLVLGNEKPLREMRQEPIGMQRRGFTVGLIEVPRSALVEVGIQVALAPSAGQENPLGPAGCRKIRV